MRWTVSRRKAMALRRVACNSVVWHRHLIPESGGKRRYFLGLLFELPLTKNFS